MRKVLIILFVFILFLLASCSNHCTESCKSLLNTWNWIKNGMPGENYKDYLKESGDYKYEIIKINDEEKRIWSTTENKNCVETYARIIGLSDEGLSKEYLVVPQFIDELEVKELAFSSFGAKFTVKSDILKKLYVPFGIYLIYNVFSNNNDFCLIMIINELPNERDIYTEFYITACHYVDGELWPLMQDDSGHSFPYCANVSYYYNYENAPNLGYYWIDVVEKNSLIDFIPEDPVREGYIFDGWYKEEECINKWVFEEDIIEKEGSNPRHFKTRLLYESQENKLFAKWIEEC